MEKYGLLKNSLELGNIALIISVDNTYIYVLLPVSRDFLDLNRDPGAISERLPGGDLGIQVVLVQAMMVALKPTFYLSIFFLNRS